MKDGGAGWQGNNPVCMFYCIRPSSPLNPDALQQEQVTNGEQRLSRYNVKKMKNVKDHDEVERRARSLFNGLWSP